MVKPDDKPPKPTSIRAGGHIYWVSNEGKVIRDGVDMEAGIKFVALQTTHPVVYAEIYAQDQYGQWHAWDGSKWEKVT